MALMEYTILNTIQYNISSEKIQIYCLFQNYYFETKFANNATLKKSISENV